MWRRRGWYLRDTDLGAELGATDLGAELKTSEKTCLVTVAVQRQRTSVRGAWRMTEATGVGLSSRWLTVAPSPCGWL